MFNELNDLANPVSKPEEQNIFISRFASVTEGGTRDLFEAQFYRETCLAEEKHNSSLLSVTLDKLIKAMAPLK